MEQLTEILAKLGLSPTTALLIAAVAFFLFKDSPILKNILSIFNKPTPPTTTPPTTTPTPPVVTDPAPTTPVTPTDRPFVDALLKLLPLIQLAPILLKENADLKDRLAAIESPRPNDPTIVV